MVVKAEEAFMTLPAVVRARFANDPAGIFTFCKTLLIVMKLSSLVL